MSRSMKEMGEYLRMAQEKGNKRAEAAILEDMRAARNVLAEQYRSEVDATEGMSGGEKFKAGIGQGLTQAYQGAGNMLGLVDDETVKRREETDSDLMRTGAGLAGSILGGAAATAPIGMGAGALAGRGLQALGRGAGLARTLAMAGAQGASEGAVMASPGSRGQGALVGGALGAGMTAAGRGLGKTMDFFGKNRMTPEAIELTKRMRTSGVDELEKAFIPASQAAKPGMIKQMYEGGVANLPWSGPKLRGQYDDALEGARMLAVQNATPPDYHVEEVFTKGDDIQTTLSKLKAAWDDAFTPVNDAPMRLDPGAVSDNVAEQLAKYDITVPSGDVTGKQLNTLRGQIQGLIDNELPGPLGQTRRTALTAQKDRLTAHMRQQLKANLGDEVAEDWAKNLGKYGEFEKLMKAASKNPGTSEFSMKQLAAEASKKAGRKGLLGEGGGLQEIGALGQKTLRDFPSRQGIFQTLAATGAAGAAAGYLTDKGTIPGAAVGIAIPILIAGGLTHPQAQRVLMEGAKSPQVARALLTKYPELAAGLGRYARQAAVATTGDR